MQLPNVDFKKIRPHAGSQNIGFEELCCQLFSMEPPHPDATYIRKEGAGGDGGVECYWKLPDGKEYSLQAKYFPDGMDSNKWAQVTKSVKAFSEKHPSTTKYYICIPLDRTDSRKITKSGEKYNSMLKEWDKHVEEWKGMTSENVEFVYWGASELISKLSNSEPGYTGKLLYWFGLTYFTDEYFYNRYEESRAAFGERYTPELNVELPIIEELYAVSSHPEFWTKLEIQLNELCELESSSIWRDFKVPVVIKSKILEFLSSPISEINKYLSKEYILKNSAKVLSICDNTVGTFYQRNIEENQLYIELLSTIAMEEPNKDEVADNLVRILYAIKSTFSDLKYYIGTLSMRLFIEKKAILTGRAGSGKSHLMCDIATKFIESKLPVVLFPGWHYRGVNPWSNIIENLDLRQYPVDTILGALDAAGKAKGIRTLILIDAINEGEHSSTWKEYIPSILQQIDRFDNLAIVFSCRDTFLKNILGKTLFNEDILPQIIQYGFEGYEEKAAEIYLDKQGLQRPAMPILAPEFSNPLMLKICTEGLLNRGLTSFPKGLGSKNTIFEFYLETLDEKAVLKYKSDPDSRIVSVGLNKLAKEMLHHNYFRLTKNETYELLNNVLPANNYNQSLLYFLIDEGALAEDVVYTDDDDFDGVKFIRFSFERFSDHIITKELLKDINNLDALKVAIKDDAKLQTVVLEEPSRYAGIIEELSVLVPEKYNIELVELVDPEAGYDYYIFKEAFIESLLWRKPSSVNKSTINVFKNLEVDEFEKLDVLLMLSPIQDHPLNAQYLHDRLITMSIIDRDLLWSKDIARFTMEEDEHSALKTIINWAWKANHCNTDQVTVELCSIVLIWATSTNNRLIRDKCTKAAISILLKFPISMMQLIKQFNDVNDPYVTERLYAIAYGLVLNIDDKNSIKSIADITYDFVFSNHSPCPNIMLRHYAKGIIEYAIYLGLIQDEDVIKNITPPYDNDFELHDPEISEIEELDEKLGDTWHTLKSTFSDFCKHELNQVHDWFATPLKEVRPKTVSELMEPFIESLNEAQMQAYNNMVHVESEIEEEAKRERLLKKASKLDNIQIEFVSSSDDSWERKRVATTAFTDTLSSKDAEYYRWLSGAGRHGGYARFSRQWAARWICQKVNDIGYDKVLFEAAERYLAGNFGRERYNTERFNKKYMYIGLYEFLAHLADKFYYEVDKYSSEAVFGIFENISDIYMHNIDPSILCYPRNNQKMSIFNHRPYGAQNTKEKEDWIQSESDIPDIKKLLLAKDANSRFWSILYGYYNFGCDKEEPKRDFWFIVKSIVIYKKDLGQLIKETKGKYFYNDNPNTHYNVSSGLYYGEYPWRETFEDSSPLWTEPEQDKYYDSEYPNIKVPLLPILRNYEWDSYNKDKSIESRLSFYCPSPYLIEELRLQKDLDKPGTWVDSNGEDVFINFENEPDSSDFALIDKVYFERWLNDNDLMLVWFILGEKMLFNNFTLRHKGLKKIGGFYWCDETGIQGEYWTDDNFYKDEE